MTTIEKPKNDFDVKKALDKKGFVEFLAKHPDSLDNQMTDAEEIKAKFEAFEKVEVISKKYKEIMSGKIEEELGLKLSADDFESVDTRFQEMSIEDPDKLLKVEITLKSYEEYPLSIIALDKSILEAGGSSTELTNKKNDIASEKELMERVVKTVGFGRVKRIFEKIFNKRDSKELEQDWKAREVIGERYGKEFLNKNMLNASIDGYGDTVSNLEGKIAYVTLLEGAKNQITAKFAEKRAELFEGMRGFNDIIGVIKKRVESQMDQLLNGKNIKDFEKANDRLSKLRQSNEKGEFSSGILKEEGFETDQGRVDENLKGLVGSEIYMAMDQVKMGAGTFSKLEKEISSIIKMNTLGSKTKEETKVFMEDVLIEFILHIDTSSAEGKAKRLMLLRIISTLE